MFNAKICYHSYYVIIGVVIENTWQKAKNGYPAQG